MSKDYNYEVGYETLQKEWEIQLKRTPRGVSLAKKKSGIYLQFKTSSQPRKQYACACSFSIDGMHEAVRKSHLVKAKLTSMTSETEFWDWYKKEIEEESRLVDDTVTFKEAIAKVEDDYWSKPDRRRQPRDKNNPSHQSSWYDTYYRFYKHLPSDKNLNLKDIQSVISNWKKGTKTYKGVVSAMKKLAEMNRRKDIHEELSVLDVTQVKYKEMSNATLKDFLAWRDEALGTTQELHPNCHLDVRKAWLWVFSIQVVYGLRIHEVFAIANATKSYTTKDGVLIPALNDSSNTDNIIVLQGKTLIDTTTKTGYRLARPIIPPKYPNLLEILDIKNPLIPNNEPKDSSSKALVNFYNNRARRKLLDWNAPTTETHAFRHLANVNGMQAGIPLEVRAQSMGHTPAMNDSTYKKRQSTQTTIDLLLNSNQNAIDFVTALAEAKKLVNNDNLDRDSIIRLLSIIYQKDIKSIDELI